MKPVAIFRHASTEGPGYFAEFLDERGIPWQLIAIDTKDRQSTIQQAGCGIDTAGDAVPPSAAAYSGLVFMGGPMSVSDDLPWIPKAETLIRDAVAKDIPLLGHCLGGQLISKALGGVVTRNPVKEIGWGEVIVSDNDIARSWFGDIKNFQAFHWHGETFTLPQGATHLLSSAHCVNQAYAIGKHLALQCHIEMTAEMIATWCEVGADEVKTSSASPAVQSVDEIQRRMADELPRLSSVATQLYGRWLKGVRA